MYRLEVDTVYARLTEKLAGTPAIKWFSGHVVKHEWIVEVKQS